MSKITRRAALGTLAGGAAASSFAICGCRKKEPAIPIVSSLYEGEFEIPPGYIETRSPKYAETNFSDVDIVEVHDFATGMEIEAVRVLAKARDSWLKFKGIDAQLTITYKSQDKVFPKGENTSGQLKYRTTVLPGDTTIWFSSDVNNWSFEMKGTKTPENLPKIKGNPLNPSDPILVSQMLAIPAGLAGLQNHTIHNTQTVWKVTGGTLSGSGFRDSHEFESYEKPNGESVLMPAVITVTGGMTRGELTEFIPKSMPDGPRPLISFSEYIESGDKAFPCVITAFANAKPLSRDDCIVFTFSDAIIV